MTTINKKYQFTVSTIATIVLLLLFAGIGINNIRNVRAQQSNHNLTGTWSGNDGGIYYIREVGNDIFWLGVSGSDDGRGHWSNVFKGIIHGNTIVGSWADVPRGAANGAGTLTLQIDNTLAFHRVGMTGSSFSTSTWTKHQPALHQLSYQ